MKDRLRRWAAKTESLEDFSVAELDRLTRETAAETAVEAKNLIHPLRFVLTGKTATPGLFELMHLMGKQECLTRLNRFLREVAP
jgi:glutamyl-tRNA synthetase